MKHPPHSKDLRKGRYSEPKARYFITFNTRHPSLSLATPTYFEAFQELVNETETIDQISEVSYTIMPDHIHMIFRLGEVLTLSQVIGKLKQQSRKRSQLNPLNWQDGYQDHKLRNDGELHPILHYVYMNPYRAKLAQPDSKWPFTHIAATEWEWFQTQLNKDCPYPEWLA